MLQPLKINKKTDNDAKLATIINENIPSTEYMSADEVNSIIGKINEMVPMINAATGGFQGTILAADKPTAVGFYFPKESKKYVNTGGFDVDLTKGMYIITNDGKKWDVVFSAFLANGEVMEGDNRPVSGDTVKAKLQEENDALRQLLEAQNFVSPVFVSTWDTRNVSEGSSDVFSIKLPITNMTGLVVDWGDGAINSLTEHKYKTQGVKTISIKGEITTFSFQQSGDFNKILSIDSWGIFIPSVTCFSSCIYLKLKTVIGFPAINTSLQFFIGGNLGMSKIDKINNLEKWKTNNVTNFSGCFFGLINFEGKGIEFWNWENCTDAKLFLSENKVTVETYDKILVNMASQNLKSNWILSMGNAKYSDEGKAAREKLINNFNITVQDGGHF